MPLKKGQVFHEVLLILEEEVIKNIFWKILIWCFCLYIQELPTNGLFLSVFAMFLFFFFFPFLKNKWEYSSCNILFVNSHFIFLLFNKSEEDAFYFHAFFVQTCLYIWIKSEQFWIIKKKNSYYRKLIYPNLKLYIENVSFNETFNVQI